MLKEKKNKPQNIIDKGVSEGLQLKLKKKEAHIPFSNRKNLIQKEQKP